MAAFASNKCKICSKTVYPMDPQINLDGSVFHRACAKCADCNCQITIANFTKNETPDSTLLLCKTHYFQRFREGGSYVGGEKFQNKSSTSSTSALASLKTSSKCRICSKSVYPMDPQINLDGSLFHLACAKCADCKCQITLANFSKNDTADSTLLLCKTHYFKRFHEGGAIIGGDKYQVKNTRDLNAAAVAAAASDPVKSTNGSNEVVERSIDFASLRKGQKSSSTASPSKSVADDDTSRGIEQVSLEEHVTEQKEEAEEVSQEDHHQDQQQPEKEESSSPSQEEVPSQSEESHSSESVENNHEEPESSSSSQEVSVEVTEEVTESSEVINEASVETADEQTHEDVVKHETNEVEEESEVKEEHSESNVVDSE